jgi:hypothetical protein
MSIIFPRTAFTAAQLLDSSTKQNFRQKKVEQCDKMIWKKAKNVLCIISIPVPVSEFCWPGSMIWLLKKPNV